ncbi:potassium/sodium hyperpolarization-activated cyclic nucleotide-gated channel 2 [Oryctolagus cuniculus]|uniref:potassium/sodium hyperpolarization-activated cyclic nucleotide-gated channel 2 n=1 Tax=Oryctolagus cuniculus TaxID=9986 RepID=UPI002231B7BE|nr:potassium/sodium hyperpolarization-activated cyclic nucleotide-gated channel 2 [Oryctolagus cuniculus]
MRPRAHAGRGGGAGCGASPVTSRAASRPAPPPRAPRRRRPPPLPPSSSLRGSGGGSARGAAMGALWTRRALSPPLGARRLRSRRDPGEVVGGVGIQDPVPTNPQTEPPRCSLSAKSCGKLRFKATGPFLEYGSSPYYVVCVCTRTHAHSERVNALQLSCWETLDKNA